MTARAVHTIVFAASLVLSAQALSQVLVATVRGVVVAHDGEISLAGRWKADGVRNPTAAIADERKVVVLDALHDQAVVVDLATGAATRHSTPATPIAGAFLRGEVYVVARDGRVLQRLGGPAVALAADPAFVRPWKDHLLVYSRATGQIEVSNGVSIVKRVETKPFASDLEIAGDTAYLTFPRDGRIRTVNLTTMRLGGEVAVGAVPVDLALTGGGTALTAHIFAVADPSAKRVWLVEGTQSTAAAVGRGFVRGLLGLGLFGGRESKFPTGIDRVASRGNRWVAYDSSSRTLYRFTRKGSSLLAREVGPEAFALTERGVAWWAGTSVAETAW